MVRRKRQQEKSVQDPFVAHEGRLFIALDALMERRHRAGDPLVLVALSADEATRVARFRGESGRELAKLLAPRIRRRVGLKLEDLGAARGRTTKTK